MLISRISFRISAGRAGRAGPASRLPAPIRSKTRAMPANDGLRSYDGEGVAAVRKQPADPAQHHPVRGHEPQSGWLASAQNVDLLPKHDDFCFQRRPRSNQIDDETEYQSDEIQHPAQRRPILYVMPTGFNLRQGQGFGSILSLHVSKSVMSATSTCLPSGCETAP